MTPRSVRSFGLALAITAFSYPALAEESADALKTRGNQAMLELNYAEALAAYRAALAKNPGDVALYYNIGRALQARDEYPEALDALREFERRAPADVKAKVPSLTQLIDRVRARVGELLVRCSSEVPNAKILVPGATPVEGCGSTPKRIRTSVAPAGEPIEIQLESDEYQAASVKVPLKGGAPPAEVAFEVRLKATSGLLRLRTTPPSAVVAVDGTVKGNTPLELMVTAGSHVLDVDAAGHEKSRVPFVIDAGGQKDLEVTLEKTRPITQRWWFWTGAGVLAAAAVTAGAILIIQPERDPQQGSIAPGIIQAPLVGF